MNYKLNVNDNEEVEVIVPAGSDYVRTSMPIGQAKGIIESADSVEKSDKFDGFGICVNGAFYFSGKLMSGKASKADVAPKAKPTAKKTSSKKKA